MVRETNRYLLARIPVVRDERSGRAELRRTWRDPRSRSATLHAAQLFGTGKTNLLIDALRDDAHLARFLNIPGKENGFDIEGLAVFGKRVFLGLRGPVLRGWAVVLEISVAPLSEHYLTLHPIGDDGALYRKHFLDLDGLGIRELLKDGRDLLILAGPTMDIDGDGLVYRWKKVEKVREQAIVTRKELDVVLDFPLTGRREPGSDHPEAMALLPSAPRQLLVVYDSPSRERRIGKRTLVADAFAV
jgi:hypothetical protein